MMNFIAGPAIFNMYKGNQLIAVGKTNIDSSIALGSSAEDVRAGMSNALYGKYYHTSTFDVTLTEIMFKLEYLAMQTGSTITSGGDIYSDEQVTLTEGGAGTVSGTPVDFATYGTIGWAAKAGTDNWQQITFSGKSFTISGANSGDVYCVKYLVTDATARKITVSSAFIPDTVKLVLTANLYAGDVSTVINAANSTLSGQVQIEIPRFQFNGNTEISMTSTGVANVPLSGSALANSSADCTSSGYYAIITEKIFGANWYDNVFDIAVAGGEITLGQGGMETLVVRAIPTTGAAFVVPNTDLNFTSKDSGTVNVDTDGKVTAGTAGSTSIIVTIKNKPEVEGVAYITVTE